MILKYKRNYYIILIFWNIILEKILELILTLIHKKNDFKI